MTERHQRLADLVSNPDYAGLTPEEVFAALTAPVTAYGTVSAVEPCRDIATMSVEGGPDDGRFVWGVIQRAAAYEGDDPALLTRRDLAERLIFVFEGGLPINMGGAQFDQLAAASQAAGFFSADQIAAIRETGAYQTTLADQAGLTRLSIGEVAWAMDGFPDATDEGEGDQ